MSTPTPIDPTTLFSLTSKTALITGATGGLGTAMTIALASSGADIICITLPSDPHTPALAAAVTALGRRFRAYETDVGDSRALRATFATLEADGERVDILLNCAGVQRRADAVDFTDEEIEVVLDVNLKATLVACQEFARPLLREGRRGKIINIAR
jgi:2-deoxy-D-gluconate 3-dehydrogenase